MVVHVKNMEEAIIIAIITAIGIVIVAGVSNYFDNWVGILTEEGTIVGVSRDEAGTEGEFEMIRVG